jgi:expansin (peptidoglycan-binding protein)
VNTDGWAATQNAGLSLFPAITKIECFLQAFIKMRAWALRHLIPQNPSELEKMKRISRLAIAPVISLVFILLVLFSPTQGQTADSIVHLPLVLNRYALNPVYQGIATYYNATGDGACMFGPSPQDLMVTALNAEQYDNALWCGAYVHVIGPEGDVVVRIVDLCPECKTGHLDLSREAFDVIGDLPQGIIPITWRVISPELEGSIAYHFKDGSNQWWTAVQVRNHRNPVAEFEYLNESDQWVAVPRTSYNYFVQTSPGMGPGPYTFRVTDIYGNQLVDSGIPHVENGTVQGMGQFPRGP